MGPVALYAFDGTWNREHSQDEVARNTNVKRFFDLYEGTLRLPTTISISNCFHALALRAAPHLHGHATVGRL
jgi:hypothetical protein